MAEENNQPQGAETNSEAAARPAGATPRDKDALGASGEPRPRAKRRRKVSYLTANKIDIVDYKDIAILRRFINDRGKILPARQTGNTAKQQRMIARAIRKAREMALLPFVVSEAGPERPRERGGYRERGEFRGDRERSYERKEPAAEAPAEPAAAEAASE